MRLLFAISFNSFSDRFIILILFAKKKKKNYNGFSWDGCFLDGCSLLMITLDKSKIDGYFADFRQIKN